MRSIVPNIMRPLLSGWALVACIPLMVAGYLLAGIVAMAADDFERAPTRIEMAVIFLGFLPVIWFAAIVTRLVWRRCADTARNHRMREFD